MTYLYEMRLGFEPFVEDVRTHKMVMLTTAEETVKMNSFPREISLVCRMVPRKVDLRMQLDMVLDQRSCGCRRLVDLVPFSEQGYLGVSGVESIDLLYDGEGFFIDEQGQQGTLKGNQAQTFKLKEMGKALYTKEFPRIYQGLAMLVTELQPDGSFKNVEKGIPNHLSFYSVGGLYAPEKSLEEMEPLFVSPFYQEGETHPYLRQVSELMSISGVRPPNRLKMEQYTADFYDPASLESYFSLGEALTKGFCSLKVYGQEGGNETFVSTSYERKGADQVLICFVPEE